MYISYIRLFSITISSSNVMKYLETLDTVRIISLHFCNFRKHYWNKSGFFNKKNWQTRNKFEITLFSTEVITNQCIGNRPVWLNGCVFVYELSGCGFKSRCCRLIYFTWNFLSCTLLQKKGAPHLSLLYYIQYIFLFCYFILLSYTCLICYAVLTVTCFKIYLKIIALQLSLNAINY